MQKKKDPKLNESLIEANFEPVQISSDAFKIFDSMIMQALDITKQYSTFHPKSKMDSRKFDLSMVLKLSKKTLT